MEVNSKFTKFEDYQHFITQTFVYPEELINERGILKESKRVIVDNEFSSSEKLNIPYYLIPKVNNVKQPKTNRKVRVSFTLYGSNQIIEQTFINNNQKECV